MKQSAINELQQVQPQTQDSQDTTAIPGKGGKSTEKNYGYSYDSAHEAALEGKLIHLIGLIGQIRGSKVPYEIQGEMQALITEIRGFLRKWKVYNSYAEKCGLYINSQKNVDLFVMNNLFNNFMHWADALGFKNPTNKIETWEKHFLGHSN